MRGGEYASCCVVRSRRICEYLGGIAMLFGHRWSGFRLSVLALRSAVVVLLFVVHGVFGGVALGQEPSSGVVEEDTRKPVPNIFTPNGDGLNDMLVLNSSESLTLTLFNQLGMQVYRVSGKLIEWNGTNEYGRPIPDGVYFFVLDDPLLEYDTHRGFLYISRKRMK